MIRQRCLAGLILTLVIAGGLFSPSTSAGVQAATPTVKNTVSSPIVALASCTLTAENPFHSGPFVYGYANVSCSGAVPYIQINIELAGPNPGSWSVRCPTSGYGSITYCRGYVNRNYLSGSWQTKATGLSSGWSDFKTSASIGL